MVMRLGLISALFEFLLSRRLELGEPRETTASTCVTWSFGQLRDIFLRDLFYDFQLLRMCVEDCWTQ